MKTKPVNNCPVPRGILMAVGGKENRGEDLEKEIQRENEGRLQILRTLISLSKKDSPSMEVITTASSEPDKLFEEYRKAFTEIGVKSVGWIHHEKREDAFKERVEEMDRITKANIIFLSGGDQLKLTTIYGGTEFLFKLKMRYIHEPVVIAGSSAGAMALSTPMIISGNKEVQQISGEIKITTGLEFLKDVCIDTHFVDRGRFVRMAQVIATNPTCMGIGIEEDTALIVRNGIEVDVCGSGVVTIIDGRDISTSNLIDYGKGVPVSIKGLNVDLLSKGDSFVIKQTNPPHI